MVNLGDLLSGGLQPRETVDRLLALDLPTVRGNHGRQVLIVLPEPMGASNRGSARNDQRRAPGLAVPER